MEDLITLAVEGGWLEGYQWKPVNSTRSRDNEVFIGINHHNQIELPKQAIFCDPLFFQALGRKCGWGEWTMKLSDVVHIWEIEFYKPDTSKTPVYICDKCFARKVNEIVTLEIEYSYEEVKEGNYESRKVIRAHGGYLREPWIDIAKRFHEINLTEGWDKAVAYLQEVTK